MEISNNQNFINDIKSLLLSAKERVNRDINSVMVYTYYEIGRRIVEEEQKGRNRAEYGKEIIKNLSIALTKEFGKGYSIENLKQIRRFYIVYSNKQKGQSLITQFEKDKNETVVTDRQKRQSLITQFEKAKNGSVVTDRQKGQSLITQFEKDKNETVVTDRQKGQSLIAQFQKQRDSRENSNIFVNENNLKNIIFNLTWTHYLILIRIKNNDERAFYEIESIKNNWSVRELKRQYNSSLYERLILSKNKDKVLELSRKGQVIEKPQDAIKDPYVLEFLNLKEEAVYTEKELERKIIDKLQDFILELGNGFMFVERQMRISFDEEHFYPDLVFYNRILRCFVIIDLKIGALKHQDIGQIQMYVNYFDRNLKYPEENKTIGILLCKEKNDSIVRMTLPEDNEQIFASKYETILPSKAELKKIIEDK